jgi:hypothetical protein
MFAFSRILLNNLFLTSFTKHYREKYPRMVNSMRCNIFRKFLHFSQNGRTAFSSLFLLYCTFREVSVIMDILYPPSVSLERSPDSQVILPVSSTLEISFTLGYFSSTVDYTIQYTSYPP